MQCHTKAQSLRTQQDLSHSHLSSRQTQKPPRNHWGVLATPHLTPAKVESPMATSKTGPAASAAGHGLSLLIPSMEGTFRAGSQGQNTPSINTSLHMSHRATCELPSSRWQQGCDILCSCRQSHQSGAQGKSMTC